MCDCGPTAPWQKNPYGIVSLFDMAKWLADRFVVALAEIDRLSSDIRLIAVANKRITEVEGPGYWNAIRPILKCCIELELDAALDQIDIIDEKLANCCIYAEFQNELLVLHRIIIGQLKKRAFIYLPVNRAALWDATDPFQGKAFSAFKGAIKHMVNAESCYAVGLPDACVFQCMVVLERGLEALAKSLQVPFGVDDWGTVINNIEAKIAKLKNLHKTTAKIADQQFYSEAAKEFSYFKDAWRNHVSHGRVEYTDRDAWKVMGHVRDFMNQISERLSE